MKKNDIYRLCLKAGTFKITPVFKITVGKFTKTVNAVFMPAEDKQRYNYDLYFERSKQPEIIFQVFAANSLVGSGKLKIDGSKNQMPNESVEILDKKEKVGVIQISLKKIDKKNKKPPMKIKIVQASYNQDLEVLEKMNPLVMVKYADNNYNTQEGEGKTPQWKKQFNIGTGDSDRIFLESWAKQGDNYQFIGVSLVDIASKIGGQHEAEVIRDKNKQGMLKYQLLQHTSKRPDKSEQQINDKNFIKPRNIKTFVEQAPMKQKISEGFIQLQTGNNKYNTDKVIPQGPQIKCNQSIWVKATPGDEFTARVIKIENDIEETVASCTIKVDDIKNKKQLLALVDQKGQPKGHIILEFNDDELDIKQQINGQNSSKSIKQKSPQKASISPQTAQKISDKHAELKNRYANRQSIHDYMADVNAILQEGLLMIAKERPEDPIKNLGLFLINYKK